MTNTAHLALTLVDQAQAQKEVTVNTALARLDAILNTGVISRTLSTPPVSPADGDVYIVLATGTGAWASHDNHIAYYVAGAGWSFITPKTGCTLWSNADAALYTWTGSAWSATLSASSIPLLGVNATADATNKLSVSSSAILFNHIGNGTQIKLNKNANTDTNSFLFQTGFSGRAEFGGTGDDDFHLKVSANGSAWTEAFVVNRTSGDVAFQKGVRVKEGSNLNMGLATLVAGTVTVSNTQIVSNSRIFLTNQNPGGTLGTPYVFSRTAGTSFTIKSTSASDTSDIAWLIVNQG